MSDTASSPHARLVALVVTHERLAQLKVTLARLLQSPPGELAAILVVDNASADGTGEWLEDMADPRLHVLRLPDNRGGAGGFEAGMRHAMVDLAPDWVVVMDDDARPAPGALADFHAVPRDPRTAYAAAVRYPDGGICEMNRPGLNPFARPSALWRTLGGGGRDGYHMGAADYDGTALRPVDMGSFVGLFVPRAAIEVTGYPEGALFLYGDDAIYSLRMRAAGIEILFDPNMAFEHDCATYAPGGGVARIAPLWKAYYLFRNRLVMYRHAAGPVLFWLFAPVLIAKWRSDARHYGADADRFRAILARAVRDGVGRRLGIGIEAVRAMADPVTRSGSCDGSGPSAEDPSRERRG
ncbi:glycosyltransferase [Palleronia sp. LCG004]|uniref:glycosyltransferase n=1 Tax=Palleronia sp. LCG004 TaxID=3079304 RepID=UPI0029435F3B|nr:glycosyltransferase [Palleronia sp. LCG004]WOI58381.1 glycosyltransferase [Palleronia sp. LCG004]